MKFFVLLVAIVVLILLLSLFYRWIMGRRDAALVSKMTQGQPKRNAEGEVLLVTCPVCNSALMPGENIVSRVFRPMNVPDQLCTIYGCPHCYPKAESGLKRECPVCKKAVAQDGHLVARLFNYKDKKKHVRVMGCTSCCPRSAQ